MSFNANHVSFVNFENIINFLSEMSVSVLLYLSVFDVQHIKGGEILTQTSQQD